MTYSERMLAGIAANGMVQNVFGEWIDPDERRPSPCIQIPITAEMRARDAMRQAPTPSAWKLKATLSEANLGIVRPVPKVQKPPKVIAPPVPAPEPAKPLLCKCGRKLAKDNARTTCVRCHWQAKCRAERRARRVKCDTLGCSRLLRAGRASGLCKKCSTKLNHPAAKRRWREKRKREREGRLCV